MIEEQEKTEKPEKQDIHIMPRYGFGLEHECSKNCWCNPVCLQEVDEEHDKCVWLHVGSEDLQ